MQLWLNGVSLPEPPPPKDVASSTFPPLWTGNRAVYAASAY